MKNLTFSQAIEGFILDKQAAGKSAHTIRNYRNTFNVIRVCPGTIASKPLIRARRLNATG